MNKLPYNWPIYMNSSFIYYRTTSSFPDVTVWQKGRPDRRDQHKNLFLFHFWSNLTHHLNNKLNNLLNITQPLCWRFFFFWKFDPLNENKQSHVPRPMIYD